VQQRSETYVEYLVQSPAPTGQILNFSASDSIVFWIRSDFIWGERIRGRLAIKYDRTSDSESVPINYPSFIKDAVDSLRGKLVFDSVPATISITTRMPGSAYLDTVYLDYSLWNPANPTDVVTGHDTLIKARNNSVYTLPVDLTVLINQFPDSLNGSFHAVIPVGSEALIVCDAMPSVADALGRMTVKVDAHYQINIGLGYQVTSQATVPMGTQMVDLNGYTMLSKLEDPSASLNMDLTNYTNVNIRLLCLMAPEELAADLNELDGNYITAQLAQSAGLTSGGYLNLFGPNGVEIPQRGGFKQNRITLTEAQMDALFKARDSGRVIVDRDTLDDGGVRVTRDTLDRWESKAAMRWQMQMQTMNMDALHDTDFVRVKASFYLEGIANTDSLFSDW